MSDSSKRSRSVTLAVPPVEQWVLHHVLLDRIEQEATTADPSRVDPPPVEVFQAFETLDAGEPSFTLAQLDAIQTVLAASHHAPKWERDRARIEQLLHRITNRIDQHHAAHSAD